MSLEFSMIFSPSVNIETHSKICKVFFISNGFFLCFIYAPVFNSYICISPEKLDEELASAKIWCFHSYIHSNAMGLIYSKK